MYWKEHRGDEGTYRGSDKLRCDETRNVIDRNTGERRGESARKGDRRVGERGGGREPIGRGDRQSDQPGHRLRRIGVQGSGPPRFERVMPVGGAGWSTKKRSISRAATGPRGSELPLRTGPRRIRPIVSVSTSNGPLRTVSGLLSVRWNRGLVSGITWPRAGAIRDEEHAQPCGIRIFPRRVTSRFSRRGAAK